MASLLKSKYNSVENKYPRIKTDIFPLVKPDFKKLSGSKEQIILDWMRDWIKSSLKNGQIKENNLLPLKADLAYYFGVGEGTVQNAIRKLEDEGLVISKQRIGTLIASPDNSEMQKLTSKRDIVAAQIKTYIAQNNLNEGDVLPNMKELEKILGAKRNTIRASLDFLAFKGIIKPAQSADENKVWIVVKSIQPSSEETVQTELVSETLAQKVALKIEDYIIKNAKIGDRLDPINIWAKRFNVSDKTAYDAMQTLFNKGVIKARRGRYGTIVVKMPHNSDFEPAKETSIFMSADQAAIYSYKRIENFLRNKIKTEYEIGQKLPSMKELSEMMDVSANTIRKAVLQLALEGYVNLLRGRFGGIYVTDIPEEETPSFKWLAVNPQFVKSYKN